MIRLFLALLLLGPLASRALAETQNHKAHVHGIGKLTIAFESDTKAEVDLDVPADSIYGFEHKARTDAERAAQSDAYRKLRDNVATLVGFAPELKCSFKVGKIGVENEAEEHQDFNASYQVNCQSPIAGTKAGIHLLRFFPRIHKLKVQVLTSGGQTENEVKDETQQIAF